MSKVRILPGSSFFNYFKKQKSLINRALRSVRYSHFLAEMTGFEPAVHFCTHPFQGCTLNHSDTSPYYVKVVSSVSVLICSPPFTTINRFATTSNISQGIFEPLRQTHLQYLYPIKKEEISQDNVTLCLNVV